MESQNLRSLVPKKDLIQERNDSVVRMVQEDFKGKGVNLSCVPIFINKHTSLFTAITFGNVEALRELLSDPSVDINTREEYMRGTVLHWAVECSSSDCIDLLLTANPDVNILDANDKVAAELKPTDPDALVVIRKIEDHLVKLCAAKIAIHKSNVMAINQKGYWISFILYSDQVDKMMKRKISPTSVITYYDILMTKERELVDAMRKFIEEKDWEFEDFEDFPAYADIIKLKLKRVFARI